MPPTVLPMEIVMDVLQLAQNTDRKAIFSHCLLSHGVKTWIQQNLYHAIFLTSVKQSRLFLRTLERSPSLSIIPNILIFRLDIGVVNETNSTLHSTFSLVFEKCPSVHSLSWMTSWVKCPIPLMPNLRHLYLWTAQDLADFSIPPTVTHLALMRPYHSDTLPLEHLLGGSPLTHVAICVPGGLEHRGAHLCELIAHGCPRIHQFSIALVNKDRDLVEAEGIVRAARSDSRIVPFLIDWVHRRGDPEVPVDGSMDIEYVISPETMLFGFDIPLAPGFTNIWVRAERIQARRSGSLSRITPPTVDQAQLLTV
ncbi:hypothetical protein CYLTODRAFT_426565 [Cylindrobasidium torrendii FP15055 ss-10]|uniref:F-box domain-containing protein n=1 Tax=Cylindrobasidium torrendii FP15055 ss-10 TaxID=1314674 RepID=A0A0D7AXF2_9AGAR|nr:hypothetical protein CYLTODRAFT_426565 [Cylindrobasidium torrendii FP15055 ss-10]